MGYMEGETGMCLAAAMLVRWSRLGKSDLRNQNRETTRAIQKVRFPILFLLKGFLH
jgi:hypothetical protein